MNPQLAAESKRFAIRPDYRPNLIQITRDSEDMPKYWSPERVRRSGEFQYYVYTLCQRLIRKRRLSNVLDVGCGPATKVRDLILPLTTDITLIDQPSIREIAEEHVPGAQFLEIDLECSDQDLDRRFDLIIFSDVIEHLLDPDHAIDFIRRHLSPRGVAVISTPERDILRGKECTMSGNPAHVREWNARELNDYLHARGLRVIQHHFLPQRKISPASFAASRLFGALSRKDSWHGCQAAVCQTL